MTDGLEKDIDDLAAFVLKHQDTLGVPTANDEYPNGMSAPRAAIIALENSLRTEAEQPS